MAKKLSKLVVWFVITLLPYAFIVSTSWREARAGQPISFLAWVQGEAITYAPKVGPLVDSAGQVANSAATTAGQTARSVSVGGTDPIARAVMIALLVLLFVVVVVKVMDRGGGSRRGSGGRR